MTFLVLIVLMFDCTIKSFLSCFTITELKIIQICPFFFDIVLLPQYLNSRF